MIPRYTRPEMAQIWAPDNKFRIMLEVETLAAEAMEQTGIIPQGVAKALRERGQFNVERIDEIEREVKHDVIAFLTNVTEYVGEEARYMHQGMTSSDVLDTTFAVQLQQSSDLLLAGIEKVLAALGKQSRAHQDTICIGRSHGIHAEPTTFGIKLAGHYAAFARAHARLLAARAEISVCAISGAVGTYATVSPMWNLMLLPDSTSFQRPYQHRSFRETVTLCFLRRLVSLRLRLKTSPLKFAICNELKCVKPKSFSLPGKKAPPQCPISATQF
jgi:adenylosuccinate lyase